LSYRGKSSKKGLAPLFHFWSESKNSLLPLKSVLSTDAPGVYVYYTGLLSG